VKRNRSTKRPVKRPVLPPGVKPILKRQQDSNHKGATIDDFNKGHTTKNKDRSVSFSSIEIREFGTRLGDCPYCQGPPIALSNECQNLKVLDLLEFEQDHSRDRRDLQEIRLSAMERATLYVWNSSVGLWCV
jgi:hypothetical protein